MSMNCSYMSPQSMNMAKACAMDQEPLSMLIHHIILININQPRQNEQDSNSPRPHSADKVLILFIVFTLLVSMPSIPFLPLLKLPLRSTLFSRVINFYTSLTCAYFKELCQDLFHGTLDLVEKVLHDSKIDKSNIHEIVLVAGSTCIPYIIKLISDFFNSKEPNKSINPDWCRSPSRHPFPWHHSRPPRCTMVAPGNFFFFCSTNLFLELQTAMTTNLNTSKRRQQQQ